MNEPLALCAAQKFQLLEILYSRLPNGKRVKPGTKAVLWCLADCQAAWRWSNARIAEKIGYSVRTVKRAMVELRSAGILTSFRTGRREIAQKRLIVSKAAELMSLANLFVKEKCAAASGFIRRGLEVPRLELSNHWYETRVKLGVRSVPRLVQAQVKPAPSSDLDAALRRFEEAFRRKSAG